jgi:hypothetical protein
VRGYGSASAGFAGKYAAERGPSPDPLPRDRGPGRATSEPGEAVKQFWIVLRYQDLACFTLRRPEGRKMKDVKQ